MVPSGMVGDNEVGGGDEMRYDDESRKQDGEAAGVVAANLCR